MYLDDWKLNAKSWNSRCKDDTSAWHFTREIDDFAPPAGPTTMNHHRAEGSWDNDAYEERLNLISNIFDCDGSWSGWSTCSAECTQTNTFSFDGNGGPRCDNPHGYTETKSCSTDACKSGSEECFSIDTQITVLQENEEKKLTIAQLENGLSMVKVLMHDDHGDLKPHFQQVLIMKKPNSTRTGYKIETENNKEIYVTEQHFVHSGDSCCSYDSLTKVKELYESFNRNDSVNLWVFEQDKVIRQEIQSMTKVQIDGLADVIPTNSMESTTLSTDTCEWNKEVSLVINGFVASHAAQIWPEDSTLTKEQSLRLYDIFVDDAFANSDDVDWSLLKPEIYTQVGYHMFNKLYECLLTRSESCGDDQEENKMMQDEINKFDLVENGACDIPKGSLFLHSIEKEMMQEQARHINTEVTQSTDQSVHLTKYDAEY
jgi:hypothetical protein